jgi:hypothetical protein
MESLVDCMCPKSFGLKQVEDYVSGSAECGFQLWPALSSSPLEHF